MSDKFIILVGYSGHGYVVAETALENGVVINGYSDKQEAKLNPFKLDYLGFEKDDSFVGWREKSSFLLGVGDNVLRQNIARLIENKKQIVTEVTI